MSLIDAVEGIIEILERQDKSSLIWALIGVLIIFQTFGGSESYLDQEAGASGNFG